MRELSRMATLALIVSLPTMAHASLWRMDGTATVDELGPAATGPFELTAQIDDMALAAGISIGLVCYETGCVTADGPTGAVQFGGIASRVNPLIPDSYNLQRHAIINLHVAPDGWLAGQVTLSDDGPAASNLGLDIVSNPDGSWSGTYEHDDLPPWTLSAPRWEMVDAVDPTSVPEPSTRDTFLAGVLGLAICARRWLSS